MPDGTEAMTSVTHGTVFTHSLSFILARFKAGCKVLETPSYVSVNNPVLFQTLQSEGKS